MSEGSNQSEGERVSISSDEVLVDLLSLKASRIATEELVHREERRAKRTAIIFSLMAIIGFGGIFGVISVQIKSAVNSALEREIPNLDPVIEQKARKFVDESIGEVKTVLLENEQMEEFLDLVRSLEKQDDGFTRKMRDSLLEKIRALSAVDRITSQHRFLLSMRIVASTFADAGLEQEIDEIDGLVGSVIEKDIPTSLSNADHYGRLVIGSPHHPDKLTDQVKRMKKYLDSVKLNGYPEKALMWDMFIEFKRNEYTNSATTTKHVESIADLSDEDLSNFCRFVEIFSDPSNWQKAETQQGRELKRLVAALRSEYAVIPNEKCLTPP